MTVLTLELRTPSGVIVDRQVRSIRAEDRTGWFGIRPGRTDLIAVLPPGLLLWQDEEGEGFAALSDGLLELRDGACRVIATEATAARELDAIADEVARQSRRRARSAEVHRGVVRDLAREALRRLLKEVP